MKLCYSILSVTRPRIWLQLTSFTWPRCETSHRLQRISKLWCKVSYDPTGQVRMESPPPPRPSQHWDTLFCPGQEGVPPGHVRMQHTMIKWGWGTPPSEARSEWGTPSQTEQQSEHLLRGGRYASCVHARLLSCFIIVSLFLWNLF